MDMSNYVLPLMPGSSEILFNLKRIGNNGGGQVPEIIESDESSSNSSISARDNEVIDTDLSTFEIALSLVALVLFVFLLKRLVSKKP